MRGFSGSITLEKTKMIKIALIGGAKHYHARSWSQMFNGRDKKLVKKHAFPVYTEDTRAHGAKITHVFDDNRADAELLARVCNIPNIVDRQEDVIGRVDAIIIPDDRSMKHQKRAVIFLKEGLPTFVDKTLSPDPCEAESIIALARKHKAPFMSASALRFSREIEEFNRKDRAAVGEIVTGGAIGPNELVFYGIHPLEALITLVGSGVRSVRNGGSINRDLLTIEYKDGRLFTLTSNAAMGYVFQINLYGTKGWRQVTISDSAYFYMTMLKRFVQMVKTGQPPFPPEETLEIIRILAAGAKLRNSTRKIWI